MSRKKINVIDIGSIGGFDLPWSNHVEKVAHLLSFEPNEDAVLTGNKLKYNCAVWNFDGVADFHLFGNNGTGSSLLTQNISWVQENFETIKHQGNEQLNSTWFDRSKENGHFPCQVKKLDTILDELEKNCGRHIPFHFLKSDTQSGEFFVLDGAMQYLQGDCHGLELELFRYPLYEGMILEGEVIDFLDKIGFEIAGWTGYKNSFLSQADYLFVRKVPRSPEEKKTIQLIKSIYAPQGKQKIIKSESWFDKTKIKIKRKIKRTLFASKD